ncbi:MAG: nucleoside-triphosphatase [Candidatus Micrarchaeota archaeon]
MPQNFFITGLPKAGKTGLLRRLIKALKDRGLKVGGLISPEEKHHGTRTGFYVKDIGTGRIARLAEINADGPKVSKYHVDVKSFESVAVPAMEGFEGYDVVIIDEVGPMELKSAKFADLLDRILDSDTPLIASLHEDLAARYVVNGEVILLAENNREAVYDELLESIRSIGKKAIKKKAAPAKAVKKPATEAEKKAGKKPAEAKKSEKKAAKPKAAEKKPGPKKEEGKPEKKGIIHHIKELLHG